MKLEKIQKKWGKKDEEKEMNILTLKQSIREDGFYVLRGDLK